ncbi:MAG: oligosaccharide flippase family protein [Terrimicrobiaceae bacterium]
MPVRRIQSYLARRHTVRAHLWQTAANYVQQGSAIVLGIVLARLLSPEEFGQFSYASAVLGMALLFAGMTLSPLILARKRENPSIVADAFRLARLLYIFRLIIAVSCCVWMYFIGKQTEALIGSIIALPMIFCDYLSIQRSCLEAEGIFKMNVWNSILTVASVVGIAIPAAWAGAGVWALTLPAIPLFLAQVFLFRSTRKRFDPGPLPTPGKDFHFGQSVSIWLGGLGDQALVWLDKIAVGTFAGDAALGNYNRAFNYSPVAAIVFNSLMTNPTVMAISRAPTVKSKLLVQIKCLGILSFAGLLNAIVLLFFSEPIVRFVFGEKWLASVPVFQAFAFYSLARGLASMPATFLASLGMFTHIAYCRMIALTISILVVYFGADSIKDIMEYSIWISLNLQANLLIQSFLLFLVQFSRLRNPIS